MRVSNTDAIQLYEQLGFEARGIRRGYYTDNREDALIMWRGVGTLGKGFMIVGTQGSPTGPSFTAANRSSLPGLPPGEARLRPRRRPAADEVASS